MNKEQIINILVEELGLVNYIEVSRYLAKLDADIIILQQENKQIKEELEDEKNINETNLRLIDNLQLENKKLKEMLNSYKRIINELNNEILDNLPFDIAEEIQELKGDSNE